MCKFFYRTLLIFSFLLLFACITAPHQQKSDAIFALNAAKRIQANHCSPKKFYLAERFMERADSFFTHKNFSGAKRGYVKARKYAERAEFECLLSKRKDQN